MYASSDKLQYPIFEKGAAFPSRAFYRYLSAIEVESLNSGFQNSVVFFSFLRGLCVLCGEMNEFGLD